MRKEKKKYQVRYHYYHECVIIGLKFNRRLRWVFIYSHLSRQDRATIQQDLTSRYIIFNSIACGLRDINYTLKSTLTLNFRLYIFRAEIQALNLLSNETATRKINAILEGIIKTSFSR